MRAWLNATACIGAFAAIHGAPSATAAPVDVTFTGTVIAGVDAQGQFGGGDLTGDTYVATYDFDSTRGELSPLRHSGQSLTGDFSRGDTDPLVSASVTVYDAGVKMGALSLTPGPSFVNQLATFTASAPGDLNAQALYLDGPTPMTLDNNMSSVAIPASLFTQSSFDGSAGGFGGSVFEEFASTGGLSEQIYLAPTHATFGVPAVSSAPEPGAWALIIAGVGAIGLFLRQAPGARRRQATA